MSPTASWRPSAPLAAATAAALAVFALLVGYPAGPWVSPLDDAYIHMAVARTLVEHGTWGVNPGEFASATSSPGWTLLLVASFAALGVHPEIALAWNAVAVAAVLWVADGWLRTAGKRNGARAGWLLALGFVVPLPFLGALGMEHVLQLAAVLALVRASEEERGPGLLGALAAAACAVRYESLFVVAWLGVLLVARASPGAAHTNEPQHPEIAGSETLAGPLPRRSPQGLAEPTSSAASPDRALERRKRTAGADARCAERRHRRGRRRAALAVVLGGVAPVVAFGAFSVAAGGLWVPNSVLMKAVVGHDPWEAAHVALRDGGAVVVLCVAVATRLLAGSDGRGEGKVGGRGALFVCVAVTHLVLARVGWLYRYEAWLVGWGVLVLALDGLAQDVPRAAPPGRGALLLVGAVVALPLLVRTIDAFAAYAPGSRLQSDVNMALARWVDAEWPDAVIAVDDLGAIAFGSRAHTVDLAGLGTTEVTLLHLRGEWGPARVSEVLARRGVGLAVTGPRWKGMVPPSDVVPVASLWTEFEGAPLETTIWCVDPALLPRLIASMSRLQVTDRVRVDRVGELPVDLDLAVLTGTAVQHEGEGVSFYTSGSADWVVPADGTLVLVTDGTPAEGRAPRFVVATPEGVVELQAEVGSSRLTVGPVRAGEHATLRYDDDLVDAQGRDRNLFLRRAVIAAE